MSNIKRIYAEKKAGRNIEAENLFSDIKENLSIDALEGVRILNRYDIEEMTDEDFEAVKSTVFYEAPVDIVYYDNVETNTNETMFAVEYLPGQYDQRADSAMQCIEIVTGKEKPTVAASKVYVLKGALSADDVEKIKAYCVNPVDSRIASLGIPDTLSPELTPPEDVKIFDGFTKKSEADVKAMRSELGLAMNDEDLLFCQKYFRDTEKRDPSVTEIRVIDTYWSDHCRHTTFATNIENVEIGTSVYDKPIKEAYELYLEERKALGREEKPVCLMDIAVTGMKALKAKGILDNLDESEEINACSIVVPVDVDGKEEDWLIMFKNETHNHPTEIEPFGGAATCLGGAIRDPLSGRSYVYQAMRVTGSGDPTVPVSQTLKGKLPQRKITTSAASGYSSYGNQIGLATGLVSEVYDPGYVAKRMEIGAVIGAVKKDNIKRERPEKGDVVILTGGRTGRDGCGGATGSSKEHTTESINTCGAEVQKGNPPTERKLQRLFRNTEISRMIKRCNDFGAGGVSVAIGELSDGLLIDLDAVPKKYEGLDGTELAISESQERMAVVVAKEDAKRFIEIASEENLEATLVAEVTDDRRLKMLWRGKPIVDISRDFLDTNGVTLSTSAKVVSPEDINAASKSTDDLKKAWLDNLSDLNCASQKGLSERFDSTIGANTVLMPFGGKNQLTPPEAMAAKVPVLGGETTTATLMSYGYDPEVAKWSPFHGAVYAVIQSVAKIVATGGKCASTRLTFQEYFERMNGETSWGKPLAALLGGFLAQMKLGTAAIGGKDSMSGTFMDMNVPPTLVSFAVDTAKVETIISPEFKNTDSKIVKLITDFDESKMPIFDKFIENCDTVTRLIAEKKVISAATVGHGGIALAISKMAFGNSVGASIKEDDLFGAKYGSFILEVPKDVDIEKEFSGLNYEIIGNTVKSEEICANDVTITLSEALKSWMNPLEKVFPTRYFADFKKDDISLKPFSVVTKNYSGKGIASPRVFIPVFPGTNCEYDSVRAFERAGAKAETLVIGNLTVEQLKTSIDKMVKMIDNSQIIMIPGGFSAGDEPEGSGKFIAAVFRNPKVTEAVNKLLNERDGLMLGICNGFQALIKLGLVPYGDIRDMTENSPTLTFNTIGRHVSCLSTTKIISNKSPWLWKTNVGDLHTIPFSHGEGRFVADIDTIRKLEENGQIATQYTAVDGIASYDIKANPNGSIFSVEGITSPDGRVLGKMGHSERRSGFTYKNVPGNSDQLIFESGVEYFK